MEITEVRIRRVEGQKNVLAFCSIVLNGKFAVHDLRVIQNDSRIFVAMPNREQSYKCDCGGKNIGSAVFCSYCGKPLAASDPEYTDIASPINSEFRQYLEKQILKAYHEDQI